MPENFSVPLKFSHKICCDEPRNLTSGVKLHMQCVRVRATGWLWPPAGAQGTC
jgi:hypothetical protein